MAQLAYSLVIDRPVAEVFAYVTDFARMPEWRTGMREVVPASDGPVGVGSRYRVAGEMMGRSMDLDLEVTALEVDRRLGIRAASGPMLIEALFTFEPADGGTQLSLAGQAEGTGVLKLADGLVERQAQKMWAGDFEILKVLLESA